MFYKKPGPPPTINLKKNKIIYWPTEIKNPIASTIETNWINATDSNFSSGGKIVEKT